MEIRRLPNWNSDELYHHGIKGQRWGVRRFQNPDGSLTGAGRKRLGYSERREIKRQEKIKKKTEKYKKQYTDDYNEYILAKKYAQQENEKAIKKNKKSAIDPTYVKQAAEAYEKALDKVYATKIDSLYDKKAKKSKEYKRAVRIVNSYRQDAYYNGYYVQESLGSGMSRRAYETSHEVAKGNQRILKARQTKNLNKVSKAIEKTNKKLDTYGYRVSGFGEKNGNAYTEFENTLNKKPNNSVEVNFVKKHKK